MQQRRNEIGSLRAQLGGIRNSVRHTGPKNSKAPWRNVNQLVKDGEDHINIWNKAETELGQFLAHDSDLKFRHSVLGHFSNMEALWFYVQSEERDDRTRNLHGQKLKKFAKDLTTIRVDNFRAIIMDSNYQRIKTYPALVQHVVASTAPFELYYVDRNTGMRMRPPYFHWFLEGMEEIRSALKENREPNFSSLLDIPGSDIYVAVRPVIATQDNVQTMASANDEARAQAVDNVVNSIVEKDARAPQVPSLLSALRETASADAEPARSDSDVRDTDEPASSEAPEQAVVNG